MYVAIVYEAAVYLLENMYQIQFGKCARDTALMRKTGGSPDLSNLCEFDP